MGSLLVEERCIGKGYVDRRALNFSSCVIYVKSVLRHTTGILRVFLLPPGWSITGLPPALRRRGKLWGGGGGGGRGWIEGEEKKGKNVHVRSTRFL